jgi:RimJ/RimL family protein N-acetyltransferase
MRWLPRQIYLHDVGVLVCRQRLAAQLPLNNLRTQELAAPDGAQILQLHTQLGHRMTVQRMQQRFGNGLRFFALYVGDELAGSTWAAVGDGRYIDELNWFLPILATEYWVRDVFIPPRWRGKALFPALLRLVAENHLPGCTAVWSDVDWPNTGSMRAHRNAGFEVVARARALEVAGRWRWRSALLPWHLPVQEIAPQRRFVQLQGHTLQRHQELMA